MAAINPTATSPAVVKNHETIANEDEPTTKTVGNAIANALKADESMDVDPHEEDEHSESDTRSSSSGEVAVDNPSQDICVSSVPCQYTRPKIFLLTRRKGDLEKVLTGDLAKAIKGSYSFHRAYPNAPNPGLFLLANNIGCVGLPLSEREAEVVKSGCRQAPFGKGERTVVDTSVRDTWEMDANQVRAILRRHPFVPRSLWYRFNFATPYGDPFSRAL